MLLTKSDRMKVAVYARVSTKDQELDHQMEACRRFCEYRHFEISREYSDVGSGTNFGRPAFQELLRDLRAGIYDGVVVFKLDRLGRRARDLSLTVDELERRGIKVMSITEAFDTTTPTGKAMREMFFILAQLERDNISESTRDRLAAMRAAGIRLGRKPYSRKKRAQVLKLRDKNYSIRRIAAETRLAIGTVYNILEEPNNETN
jgi:DNA invertase Pin-like site-specific DNA recombinase